MRRLPLILTLAVLIIGADAARTNLISRPAVNPDFVHFESSHVHPVAITPDGSRLLVVNTPDNRLSVFDITGSAPVRVAEIPVGVEPVSVAARTNGEAWVVNNLSDDVSIVDLGLMHTTATLRVGDEPNDVVFAGASNRAYVSVSQEDAVKVYDPANLATPPVIIPIPGRMPRALARRKDGNEVMVDVFNSSAQSTTLSAAEVDTLPTPNPALAAGLPPVPKTGLTLKKNNQHWIDSDNRNYDAKIPYTVPLVEVVYINTGSNNVVGSRGDIANIMMGAAPSPVDSAVAVTGTYALIEHRLEPNFKGHVTEQRLAILHGRTAVRNEIDLSLSRNANGLPTVDYSVSPGPQAERDSALGLPTAVCWSPDAQRLYVASLASDKIGVVNATMPLNGSIIARVPSVAGPTGVIADPLRPRLYVVGRFHNQLQTLSTASLASLDVTSIGFDPTPDAIVNGRKFFYGGFTSGHGDQACASCHVFGDFDNFAWELGNPTGTMAPAPPNQLDPQLQGFHPMKGPMVTQSLRGLINTGLLHWRGDRADLSAFNPAFVSLMGRSTQLPDSEMVAFGDFVMPLVYPPNPYQYLDRSFVDAPAGQASAVRGRAFYMNTPVDGPLKCVDCHSLPTGTNGQVIDHLALQESQDIKVPQLRNLYKKTGFKDSIGVVNKRGFGFTHDGAIDNLFNFLKFPGFNFGTPASVADANRRDVERFLLSFDTGMAPAVGYQLTFNGANNGNGTMAARMDTLEAQAEMGNCQLIAKGRIAGVPHGWLYQGSGQWVSDMGADDPVTRAQLIAQAAVGQELTVTGVPPGTGERAGIDRDRDGYLDGDEVAAGTDPGDPASHPSTAVGASIGVRTGLRGVRPNPFRAAAAVDYTLARAGSVNLAVYDLMGREIRTLARLPRQPAGAHSVQWDGRGADGKAVSNGVYFVRLVTDQGESKRRIIRLR